VEAEDEWINVMGCIRLFYPNFAIFFVLGHKCSLIISFPINRTPMTNGEASNSAIPLPPPSHGCFLRGVAVLHGGREERRGEERRGEERRESERSLQSSKEWEDVVMVFTPCKCLILSI
jgi:hypothetical protein